MLRLPRLLFICASLGLSAPASAEPVQYTYQGNPFDTFVAGATASQFTSANALQFSFVTDGAIASNSTFSLTNIINGNIVLAPNVVSWSITDGDFSSNSSSADARLEAAILTTNSSGAIASWAMTATFNNSTLFSSVNSCGAEACLISLGHTGLYAGEVDQINPKVGSFLYLGLATTPGTWSGPVAVPIPLAGAGLPGLILGAGGLLGWLRRWGGSQTIAA